MVDEEDNQSRNLPEIRSKVGDVSRVIESQALADVVGQAVQRALDDHARRASPPPSELRIKVKAVQPVAGSQSIAEIVERAVQRGLNEQALGTQPPPRSALEKRQVNAAARLLRSFGTAARFPAGAGLIGAPIAFFTAKITLPLMIFAMLAGGLFGLAALFFVFVADLTEETSV